MATIKDIARLAGVSHGTVSNVLNKRGNVSAVKISAVKKAAEQLGYQVNVQAQTLRGGSSRRIALVVPNLRAERYHDLYSGVNNILSKHDYHVEIFITNDNQDIEKKQVKLLASHQCQGVIVVSCLSAADIYYKQLSISQEKILFIYREPTGTKCYFNIEHQNEINHLTAEILKKGYKKIGVFTEPEKYSNMKKFMQHLNMALSRGKNIKLQHYSCTDSECHRTAFRFFQDSVPDVIVCSDFDKVRHLKNASQLSSNLSCPPIYTFSGEELRLEENIYCSSINYETFGVELAEKLTGASNKKNNIQPKYNDNYRHFYSKNDLKDFPDKIKILTIPSPTTDVLEKLLPHFFRITGINVEITKTPFNNLIEITKNPRKFIEYDLIRIYIATLPVLAKEIFEPLKKLTPDLSYLLDDFPNEITNRYSKVNNITYAIPFDSSAQMLFYRRDLFEDQKIRRIYFEKFRQSMNVPESFEQFDRLSLFFSELQRQGEITPTGSCVNTGGTEVIATEFLLRYYAKGGRLLNKKPPAQLDQQIAEDVLKQYLTSLDHNLRINSNWWKDAITHFEQGNLVMLLVYNNLLSNVAGNELSSTIGYSIVPGSKPLLGGGSIGVIKSSVKKTQSALFLQWLYSPTIIEQIVLLGGSSASRHQYNNAKIIDCYPWISLVEKNSICGIRENAFDDGKYFDLHKAEDIIGGEIIQIIDRKLNIVDSIQKINARLEKY